MRVKITEIKMINIKKILSRTGVIIIAIGILYFLLEIIYLKPFREYGDELEGFSEHFIMVTILTVIYVGFYFIIRGVGKLINWLIDNAE